MLTFLAPFYVCKMMEIHYQKIYLITSLILILMFSKFLNKVCNVFKDWAQKFSNNFDVWIAYVFKVGIIFKFLLISSNIFSFKFWSQNFGIFIVVYIFLWIFIIFFNFFSNKNYYVSKIPKNKTCRLERWFDKTI